MVTKTQQIVTLLTDNAMTARELGRAIGGTNSKGVIHSIITTLKKRDALLVVGKRTEVDECNRRRPNSIYKLKPMSEPLKTRDSLTARAKSDLNKARNIEHYKELLMRKNYLFMMYSKELGLKYE